MFRVPRSRAHLVHQALRQELLHSIEAVLYEPHQFDNVSLRPLEAEFATLMQRTYAFGVQSGSAGLFLALRACGVGAGSEVITVGNSDISTTAAISHCGARPVLCDVQETDYTIDAEQVEALITERTAAIVPVDLYGHPADVKRIRSIADRHGVHVVEDACLASGALDYAQPVGAFAHAAVFSVGAYKPLGSAGNGGFVVIDDAEIGRRLALLRGYGRAASSMNDGLPESMEYVDEGYNLPLDPLEAAVVAVKLPLLPVWTARRRAHAEAYAAGLRDLDVVLPTFRAGSCPTFFAYVVRVRARDAVVSELRRQGVEALLQYVPPVYRQPVYQTRPLQHGDLPVTERIADELVCLPAAPELSDDDIQYVIDVLRTILRSTAPSG